MAMTVRTNIAAMKASGQLNTTTKRLTTSLERISSGLRINKAADDAAGLGVATNLETTAMSQQQGIRNANDGISIIQTAESATNEVTDILQRMRELAIQSASETLDNDERLYIDDEFTELQAEMQRIAQSTQFNGVSLTDNSNTTLDVQVGVANSSASRISFTDFSPRATKIDFAVDPHGTPIRAGENLQERFRPQGVVFRSGNPSSFIAADRYVRAGGGGA